MSMSNYFISTLDDSLGAHTWLAQVSEVDLHISRELFYFVTHYTLFGLVPVNCFCSYSSCFHFSFIFRTFPLFTLLHPLPYIPLIHLLSTNSSVSFNLFCPHNFYRTLWMSSLLFLSTSLLSYFLSIFLSLSPHFLFSF